MKNVKIKDLVIGEGMPKICVPIVGETEAQIEQEMKNICSMNCRPDMVELRADWFTAAEDEIRMQKMLQSVHIYMEEMPVLFTFRTAAEGGRQDIIWEQYRQLLLLAARSGCVDAVDVEAFSFGRPVEPLIEELHQEGMAVIASNHDFEKTPTGEEMLGRMERMWEQQADIVKLAVMPAGMEDVLELLRVTWREKEAGRGPVITMSMSSRGVISRISGEWFGSAVTFASAGKASAPGQMEIGQLQQILQAVHSCV